MLPRPKDDKYPGGGLNLRWVDVDTERTSVNILPEEGSNPRQLKISSRLVGMLNSQPKRYSYVFRNPAVDSVSHLHRFREVYHKQRKRISAKLQNPRLDQVTFKTLRHWKATNEYHRTKDILHVYGYLRPTFSGSMVLTLLSAFGVFGCCVATKFSVDAWTCAESWLPPKLTEESFTELMERFNISLTCGCAFAYGCWFGDSNGRIRHGRQPAWNEPVAHILYRETNVSVKLAD